jgi:hypothetical protein
VAICGRGVQGCSTCANCFPFYFISSENIGDYRIPLPTKSFDPHAPLYSCSSEVILIAFFAMVSEPVCLNISEFIVFFTLDTYMFRGSEENKMRKL